MTFSNALTRIAALTLLVVGSAGCSSPHRMRATASDTTTVCRYCYDKAIEVWDNGNYGRQRWGYVPTKRVYEQHQCPECSTTMVVHTDEGQWMITCPTCAPKGVPCNKCLPQ